MTSGVQAAIGRFVWHDLNSTDIESDKRFYTELLGWEVEVFKPGEMDYQMISANGSQHGGFNASQGGAPSHWLGHVVVDDVDAAAERAKGAGGTVLYGPEDIPEVGRFALVQDPQGGVTSAFTPQGDMPSPEGVFVWDELMTSDVDGAKRFYGELYGWTTEDMDMGPAGTYTLFKVGESSIAGCLSNAQNPAPPHWYPTVAGEDVAATTKKAGELGAQVYMQPTSIPEVGRFSVLGDPTGATIGLITPEPS
jgi:uncharacterized protein